MEVFHGCKTISSSGPVHRLAPFPVSYRHGATLYDLQINQGEALYERSQNKIAETQIVEADRGDILDRNGRVLVSNRVVYQVTLDLDHMGKSQRSATPPFCPSSMRLGPLG